MKEPIEEFLIESLGDFRRNFWIFFERFFEAISAEIFKGILETILNKGLEVFSLEEFMKKTSDKFLKNY